MDDVMQGWGLKNLCKYVHPCVQVCPDAWYEQNCHSKSSSEEY